MRHAAPPLPAALVRRAAPEVRDLGASSDHNDPTQGQRWYRHCARRVETTHRRLARLSGRVPLERASADIG
jgi:hypothetical protein